MIDTAQAVLLLVVVVLTVLLTVLGIQIYFILRDLRRTVKKANKVLDDTGVITESVSGPMSSLSAISSSIKTGLSIAKIIKGKGKKIRELLEE